MAVKLDGLFQLTQCLGIGIAIQVTGIAKGNDRASWRCYVKRMKDMLCTPAERWIHHNHVDMTDVLRTQCEEVLCDNAALPSQQFQIVLVVLTSNDLSSTI